VRAGQEHRRRRGGEPRRAAPAPRRRLLRIAALTGAVAVVSVAGAFAAASKTVKIRDAIGDVTGPLDLQRASLKRGSDGRLRVVITLAGKINPAVLLASSGPPGSICLKVWTARDADPRTMPPDRLVCVTARSKDELRGSVYTQTSPGPPTRVGPASVGLNATGRSLVLRISQSSLGSPGLIRFALESTRPGCGRVSCIDLAPDRGGVLRFRVR
jgi:hypothetical protein